MNFWDAMKLKTKAECFGFGVTVGMIVMALMQAFFYAIS